LFVVIQSNSVDHDKLSVDQLPIETIDSDKSSPLSTSTTANSIILSSLATLTATVKNDDEKKKRGIFDEDEVDDDEQVVDADADANDDDHDADVDQPFHELTNDAYDAFQLPAVKVGHANEAADHTLHANVKETEPTIHDNTDRMYSLCLMAVCHQAFISYIRSDGYR
jgi:hypothetical protein